MNKSMLGSACAALSMLVAPQLGALQAAGRDSVDSPTRPVIAEAASPLERLADALGAVEYLRKLPSVDAKSIVLFGCSGGGDLALEVAAATDVAAMAPEEPASILFTGTFNTSIPKSGERYTPADAQVVVTDPSRYYRPQKQKLTREKISRIHSPILILQGDQNALNRFNGQVLIPELRAMGKQLEVITYPGEPHCFAFDGRTPRTPRPPAALKAFQDADAFFRRYVRAEPVPIDPRLVTYLPKP